MAHQTTTHRRNLAAFDPKQTIDPTTNKHPIPTTTTAITTKHNHQDPTIPPSSTIQTISNHFTKLYSNHKILSNLKKGPTCHSQHPCVDTQQLQALKDNSCTTLTKSKSQHGRQTRGIEKQRKTPFEVHDVDSSFVYQKAYGIMKQPSLSKKECKSKEVCYEQQNEGGGGGGGGDEMVRRPSFSLAVNGGGGGRRRSFCSSETELSEFFLSSGVKVVSVDMPPFMQMHAVGCARKAYDSLEKFTARTLASTLKKEFDGVYGPAWHCIVGTSFGSFVTHSVGGFMYFSMDHKLYVLLFKTTVQKAQ